MRKFRVWRFRLQPTCVPFWPSHIAYIRAERVQFVPDDFEYAMLRRPTVHLVAELQALFEDSQQAQFTIFESGLRPRQRRCHRDWLLDDFVADAVGSAAHPVRAVQLLFRPLQGYPRPQLVLTHVSAPRTFLAVPFDFRHVQGQVVTVHLPPALPMVLVPETVLSETPTPGAARFPGPLTSVRDAAGIQHFDIRPHTDRYEWLVPQFQRLDEPDELGERLPSTVTTTMMLPSARRNRARSASPTPDPEAGRDPPTLLRTATGATDCSGARGSAGPYPQVPVQARQRAGTYLEPKSFFPQVLACPRRPPRDALRLAGSMHIVPAWAAAVIAPATPLHMHDWVASVVVDRRLLGQGLDLVEVPEGTEPRHLLTAQDRQQGFEFSVNGVAAPAWRRWLRTGDVIQLMRTRISPPVWSTGFVMDFFPEARAFTVPLHLLDVEPVAAEVPDDNLAVANAASIRGQLEYFMARRLDELGRPGLGTHHVVVQGPTHGDLYLHISQPLTPDVAQVEEYLQATTFWDR
eukprot:s1035_g1.t1